MVKVSSIRFDNLTYQASSVIEGRKTSTIRIIKNLPEIHKADIGCVISMTVPAPRRGGSIGRMAFVLKSQNFMDVLKHGAWTDAPYLKGKVYAVNGLRRYIAIDDIEVIQLQDLTDGEILRDGVRYTPLGTPLGYFVPGIDGRPNEDRFMHPDFGPCRMFKTPREAAAALFDKIYGAGTWEKNPWCWRYQFHLASLNEINHGTSTRNQNKTDQRNQHQTETAAGPLLCQ